MNCPKILEMLCAYRDRELAGSDRHCVEQHLSGCPQCRGALEELERVGALLSGLPSAEPTPELFGRIVSQLFSDNRPPSPSPVLPSPPEPDPAAAAIASVPGPVILSLHKSDPEAEHRAMEQHLARSDAPHILLVSQKVKDIKLPFNPELARQMAELRRLLRKGASFPATRFPPR